jgi:hypothetical protein
MRLAGCTTPAGVVTPLAGTSRNFGIVELRDSTAEAPAAPDGPLCGVTIAVGDAIAAAVTPLTGTPRIFGTVTFRDSTAAALAALDAPLCGATAAP